VLVDAIYGDPTPLQAALDPSYAMVVARGARSSDRALARLQARPGVVWRLGSSRSAPAGPKQRAIRNQLQSDYLLVDARDYLPYSSLQRTLFGLFSRAEAPAAYYMSERWQRKTAE
jgi:hypothetical protein